MGVARETVEALSNSGLVNDEEFAKWWAAARTGAKPSSVATIKRELKSRGIADEIVEDAVSGIDDLDNARVLARKLCGGLPTDDYHTFCRRLAGRLYRRGFSEEVVRSIIEETWSLVGDTASDGGSAHRNIE